MKRQQRWTPDTCANPATNDACIFIEEWDDAVDVYSRTHDFVMAEKLCSHHAAIHGSNHAAAFKANYDENRRKNKTCTVAIALRPDLTPMQVFEAFTWSFDPQRNLTVSFGNLFNAQQKAQLQDALDIQFGQGMVTMP